MSHSVSGVPFTACAKVLELPFSPALSAGAVQGLVEDFVVELLERLHAAGCRLIGHIKGVFEAESGETLFFNVTDFNRPTTCRNGLSGRVTAGRLTVNVIVAGVEDEVAARAVEQAAARTLAVVHGQDRRGRI